MLSAWHDIINLSWRTTSVTVTCARHHGHEKVALKVQRPDIVKTVSLDLCLLRGIFSGVEAVPECRVLQGLREKASTPVGKVFRAAF